MPNDDDEFGPVFDAAQLQFGGKVLPYRPRVSFTPATNAADPLPIIYFTSIQAVLDAKDFVQGMLIEQSAIVVYGDSNAGKTFWTTDLSLHVAAGRLWNGRRVDQGGVVYAVLEGGIGFRNRVVAWRNAHGLEDAEIPFAAIPAAINLLDPDADTPRLIDAVKNSATAMGCPVKLVVIDTLARALAGGNENAPEDMGALVMNMDRIRAETGAAVLFVHHCGKDQAKGARGHSSLRAAIDTEIEVKVDEAGARTAEACKQREMPKGAMFNFTLETVTLGQNRHQEDVTSCVVWPVDPKASETARELVRDPREVMRDLMAEVALGTPQGPYSPRLAPEQPRSVAAAMARLGITTQQHQKAALLRLFAEGFTVAEFRDRDGDKRNGLRSPEGAPETKWVESSP